MGTSLLFFQREMFITMRMTVNWVSLLVLVSSTAYSQPQSEEGSEPICQLTTNDQEGPFFQESAPMAYDIAPDIEMEFHPIETFIYGRVLDANCRTVNDAIVHIWYGGNQSTPANPDGEVRYTTPPEKLWYRGQTRTNMDGEYRFHGTYPGLYDLRPIIHYHIKVIARGKELITQMYFRDDVPPQYEDYVKGRETQFPTVTYRKCNDGSRNIFFDIVMDIRRI